MAEPLLGRFESGRGFQPRPSHHTAAALCRGAWPWFARDYGPLPRPGLMYL